MVEKGRSGRLRPYVLLRSNLLGPTAFNITLMRRRSSPCADCVVRRVPENVNHVVSGCKTLDQKEYKRRHDNVAKAVHWKLS